MSAYSRVLLSGSTDGKPIVVSGTNSAGANTIHTAVAGSAAFDEIYLFAVNVTNAAATLTIEWGDTADPGGHLIHAYSVGANSAPVPLAMGLPLNNAKVVKAFSGTGSAINLVGWVSRNA
jgi:hypothetical protein